MCCGYATAHAQLDKPFSETGTQRTVWRLEPLGFKAGLETPLNIQGNWSISFRAGTSWTLLPAVGSSASVSGSVTTLPILRFLPAAIAETRYYYNMA